MGTLGALQNISGAVEGPSLASLKTAQEVAEQVRLSVGRIRELAEAMLLPHFRIDGGEPLFCQTTLKRYVRQHLTVMCEGAPLPLDLRPIVFRPISQPVPAALAAVQDRLSDCPVDRHSTLRLFFDRRRRRGIRRPEPPPTSGWHNTPRTESDGSASFSCPCRSQNCCASRRSGSLHYSRHSTKPVSQRGQTKCRITMELETLTNRNLGRCLHEHNTHTCRFS